MAEMDGAVWRKWRVAGSLSSPMRSGDERTQEVGACGAFRTATRGSGHRPSTLADHAGHRDGI